MIKATKPISLPFFIINHVIKATKPIKSTSSVPYGMLMNLIFRHFGVFMKNESRDDEVFSSSARNVATLRLNP